VTVVYTTPMIAGLEIGDPTWRMVGPLLEPREEPAAADDDGRPLVYLALGTLFSHRPALFRAPLEALATEDVRVLVSTGGPPVETVGPVPANATVVRHVDSRAVLSRAAVHVTHGGAGSVHESLWAGVPMVCLPQGSDHFQWARRIAELEVGEAVAEPDPAAIRAAVSRLLSDDAPRRRAGEVAEHLRSYDGTAAVREAVSAVLA
jgi:MGT family glycosyltransferase